MSTRRERRAQRRKQRTLDGRRTRSVPWFTALVVAVVLVGGFFALRAFGAFEGQPSGPAIDTKPFPVGAPVGEKQEDMGRRDHIPDGQRFVGYNTTPPTSGPHWGTPAPWLVYDSPQPDERLVHNLEHGGIIISYNAIADGDLAQLKSLRARYPNDRFGRKKIIIRPYDRIPAGAIALSAWAWLDRLDRYDEQRILQFIAAHMNQCCEGENAP